MQRVRFNLNFNYNGTNEAFSFPVCHHRYVGGCVLWNLTWYGYHVYDSGLIRCHWVVRLPEHEENLPVGQAILNGGLPPLIGGLLIWLCFLLGNWFNVGG